MADQTDRDLAQYDAAERRKDVYWKGSLDWVLHSERAAVDIGIGVLRTLILINAGALVALLSTQIWNRDGLRQIGINKLVESLVPFGVGMVAGAVAFGLAYFYQSAVTRRLLRDLETISIQPDTLPSIAWVIRIELIPRFLCCYSP